MRQWPTVVFANIQAKIDSVQVFFYNSVRMGFGLAPIQIGDYYTLSMATIDELNQEPNFVIYLLNSNAHGYTYTSRFSTADQWSDTGVIDSPGVGNPLSEWVRQVPLQEGESITSVCGGEDCTPAVAEKEFSTTSTSGDGSGTLCLTIKSWLDTSA